MIIHECDSRYLISLRTLTERRSIDALLGRLPLQSGPGDYQPSMYFMEKVNKFQFS